MKLKERLIKDFGFEKNGEFIEVHTTSNYNGTTVCITSDLDKNAYLELDSNGIEFKLENLNTYEEIKNFLSYFNIKPAKNEELETSEKNEANGLKKGDKARVVSHTLIEGFKSKSNHVFPIGTEVKVKALHPTHATCKAKKKYNNLGTMSKTWNVPFCDLEKIEDFKVGDRIKVVSLSETDSIDQVADIGAIGTVVETEIKVSYFSKKEQESLIAVEFDKTPIRFHSKILSVLKKDCILISDKKEPSKALDATIEDKETATCVKNAQVEKDKTINEGDEVEIRSLPLSSMAQEFSIGERVFVFQLDGNFCWVSKDKERKVGSFDCKLHLECVKKVDPNKQNGYVNDIRVVNIQSTPLTKERLLIAGFENDKNSKYHVFMNLNKDIAITINVYIKSIIIGAKNYSALPIPFTEEALSTFVKLSTGKELCFEKKSWEREIESNGEKFKMEIVIENGNYITKLNDKHLGIWSTLSEAIDCLFSTWTFNRWAFNDKEILSQLGFK